MVNIDALDILHTHCPRLFEEQRHQEDNEILDPRAVLVPIKRQRSSRVKSHNETQRTRPFVAKRHPLTHALGTYALTDSHSSAQSTLFPLSLIASIVDRRDSSTKTRLSALFFSHDGTTHNVHRYRRDNEATEERPAINRRSNRAARFPRLDPLADFPRSIDFFFTRESPAFGRRIIFPLRRLSQTALLRVSLSREGVCTRHHTTRTLISINKCS